MGITTILSAIFIVASLVWATYTFGIIQFGNPRAYPPHYEYDTIPYWPYDNGFTGGRTNWFENVNYTNVPVNESLNEDILNRLDDAVYHVTPANPPQLWRIGAFDYYDGSGWSKTDLTSIVLTSSQLIDYGDAANEIYTVVFNASAGGYVGAIELPHLFPDLRIIDDSFQTWSIVDGAPVLDVPSRIANYELTTDIYGSLLFSPLITGTTGEEVIVSFSLSYEIQDLNNVIINALPGSSAPPSIFTQTIPLSAAVLADIAQFTDVGSNAYEKAMAVQLYFQSNFDVVIDPTSLTTRPGGREVTDWFLEQGEGLPLDFATAYCVYMRELGVPARLVRGYAVGDADPVEDFRTVKVRHQTYWAEVFIPMSGATSGEWIQVIPAPLPDGFGGDEDPINSPIPDVQLNIWPTNGLYYSQLGDTFWLSASVTVEGVSVTTPETLYFYDETDAVYIGSANLGTSGIANISHIFPFDATVDYHIISATWYASSFTLDNYTSIYAVGTPQPAAMSEISDTPTDFVISETRDLNVSQGIDTHIAYWEDTLNVFGIMTVGGVPVNGSELNNKYIQIMWDNSIVGNAFIQDNGRYTLSVYVDPLDLGNMTVGLHEVWSSYAGDWEGEIPRLLPARSADNSTVTVWGRIGFTLYVTPEDAWPGANLHYDGAIQLLNGTLLPLTETVDVFFGSQANLTRGLNTTGGFTWDYVIPVTQPEGTYFARANWSSPWALIAGNWSISIPINVGPGGVDLTIYPTDATPLYVGQEVTLYGWLTFAENGSGVVNRWVDVWWYNSTHTVQIGHILTGPAGYYELNYTIYSEYQGPISYWSNFTSMEPTLTDAQSNIVNRIVKKVDVALTIYVTPDPAHLLQTVTIQGNVSLPEFGDYPWDFERITIWMQNSTGVYNITSTITNATGGYIHYYTIPLSQSLETIYFWANYTSPYLSFDDGTSVPEDLLVETAGTLISVDTPVRVYHLDETVRIFGQLQFSNGTPIQFETVYIQWTNASGTFVFTNTTDALGNYVYDYVLSLSDAVGIVNINVSFIAPSPLYADAFALLGPPLTLQLYQVDIAIFSPSWIYADEGADVDVFLSYAVNGSPLVGEDIELYYWTGSNWFYMGSETTNVSGGVRFNIGYGGPGPILIDFKCNYTATNPLLADAQDFFTIDRVRYDIGLDIAILPNPVMQNETVTIQATLYFTHNGTPITNANVSIYWYNGSLYFLGNITTNGVGQGILLYSGMDYDTVRTGIEIMGYYAGTLVLDENLTTPILLTLNQWQTEIINVGLPVTVYGLTETVVIWGDLRFISPSVPYGGQIIELRLSGVLLNTTVSAPDGSFTILWTIPGTHDLGSFDMILQFISPYPWIAGAQANVPQIDISAPGYLWPYFEVNPAVVFRTQYINITGFVTWDNGTPYADGPVDLYWGNPVERFIANYYTDGSGRFSLLQLIDSAVPLGSREVWAFIEPAGYASFGESPHRTILVEVYDVVITATVNTTAVYMGEGLLFSGTLQFANGTPMVGYDIDIFWGGTHLTTITVVDPISGAFSYAYTVPYSTGLGYNTGYAEFTGPTAAFEDESESFLDVIVYEYVLAFLDLQPSENTFSRGDTITITGRIENNAFLDVGGAVVEVVEGGSYTGFTDTTGADGSFSIDVIIPASQPRGMYILTVEVVSAYHTQTNSPLGWTIIVIVLSDIDVVQTSGPVMPGEYIQILVQLYDDDGVALHGEPVQILLGGTEIASFILVDASGDSRYIQIPVSWSGTDGTYELTAVYEGSTYVEGDVDSAPSSIHVFATVGFLSQTPGRVDPNTQFNIQVTLRDGSGNPISRRDTELSFNGTSVIPLRTNADGIISLGLPGYPADSFFTFTVTLLSSDIDDVVSETFTVQIQTQGGNPLQNADLLIAGILLVGAIVAVLAYLYIVKGMFRAPVISRGIDIPTKLRNIKKLAEAGKYGASITLAYRTFEQMCGAKIGSERTHSETAREYLERVLQELPLDGTSVAIFVQTYEEARFSHHEMTRERYEEAVRIFTDLYPRIDASAPVE